MKLTALIPAYNDAYTLQFCLASIAPHFDEVLVLDDASTDETPEVCLAAVCAHPHVRYIHHKGQQLGWVRAREALLQHADDCNGRAGRPDHLFWLDADDVLCEYSAHLLQEIAAGPSPVVLLQLCEMWGDFHHTTQRLRHYDRCHVYTRRSPGTLLHWEGGAMAKLSVSALPPAMAVNRKSAIANRQWPSGPLFFHLKGVKPDRRLVERAYTRAWLRAQGRPGALSQWPISPIGPIRPISALTDAEVHALALKHLFQSRQDRLVPSYRSNMSYVSYPPSGRVPVRPGAILAALPGRFEIIYDAEGRPVDRIDRETGQQQGLNGIHTTVEELSSGGSSELTTGAQAQAPSVAGGP